MIMLMNLLECIWKIVSILGFCVCDGANWSGYLCDRCNNAFYGPDCLPLMNVLYFTPSQGIDTGNSTVHVWGHNFPATSNKEYLCKFGTTIVKGTWEAWNHVTCLTPPQPKGNVSLEISPNGTHFTHNEVSFNR